MPCRHRCRAFTLVELLVVMALLAVLAALLPPAIQQVRDAADRTTCANNLEQSGLAAQARHDTSGTFPPAAASLPRRHGWAVHLLPLLEQQNLSAAYDWTRNWYDHVNGPVVSAALAVMGNTLKGVAFYDPTNEQALKVCAEEEGKDD